MHRPGRRPGEFDDPPPHHLADGLGLIQITGNAAGMIDRDHTPGKRTRHAWLGGRRLTSRLRYRRGGSGEGVPQEIPALKYHATSLAEIRLCAGLAGVNEPFPRHERRHEAYSMLRG